MSESTAKDALLPADQTALPARRLGRGFVGHTESLGKTFGAVLAELAAHPALLPGSWGSAYAADPWPRPLPADLPPATHALLTRHYAAQRLEQPRTVTFVTRWSGSLITLEDHEGALVLALDYATPPDPAHESASRAAAPADGPATAADGRPTGSTDLPADLPTDLPADLRWTLRGLPFASATTLLERLWSRRPGQPLADDRLTTLLGLAAVWRDDLRLAETLRQLASAAAGDWALRAAGIAVAQRLGYQLLLYELCAGETDPELQAELAAITAGGPPLGEAEEAG